MSCESTDRIQVSFLLLIASIASASLGTRTLYAEGAERDSDELLLRIIDSHAELVSNEVFLSQARLLSVYLEAAQGCDEAERSKIYVKVLDILDRIKQRPREHALQPGSAAGIRDNQETKKAEAEKGDGKAVYVPGAAILEVFTGDGVDTIPAVPVIRTYWTRDLTHSGDFLIPERVADIGKGVPYVARFSFYYNAKNSGDYGFVVVHKNSPYSGNTCKLRIGGVDVVDAAKEPSRQGVCRLEKGLHRIEFYLISRVPDWRNTSGEQIADFQVKVLSPDSPDATLITKDVMLLKKE